MKNGSFLFLHADKRFQAKLRLRFCFPLKNVRVKVLFLRDFCPVEFRLCCDHSVRRSVLSIGQTLKEHYRRRVSFLEPRTPSIGASSILPMQDL